MKELKFRAVISPKTTIYFTLEDLVNPKPLFGIRELLIPWLRAGNKPDDYTGLKDKNGREICEGDILVADRWFPKFGGKPPYREKKRVKGYVFWGDDVLGYDLKAQDTEYCLFELIEPEVIGNTHENPDLLEGD